MPGTFLSAGDERLKDRASAPKELMIQWGGNRQIILITKYVLMGKHAQGAVCGSIKHFVVLNFKCFNEICFGFIWQIF